MTKRILIFFFIVLQFSILLNTLVADTLNNCVFLPERYFPELDRVLRDLDGQAPELAVRQAYIDAAIQGEAIAAAKKLPNATVELNLLHRQEFRDEDPKHQTTTQPFARAYFSQAIYHWGAIDANREISRIRKLIERGHYRETYRHLLIDVRRTFLDIIYKQEEISVQQEHLEILRKHYETAQRNAAQNQVSSNVLQESKILLDYGLLTQERLQHELEYLQEEFARKTGSTTPIVAGALDTIEPLNDLHTDPTAIDQPAFDTLPLEPSMALLNVERYLDIEKENDTIIHSSMRPKINLVGEVFRDQISSAGSDNVDRMLAQVALNVSWNIFDGWETTHRRLQNKAHQRRLRAEAEQLRAQQRIECKRLHRTRQLILKEIAISKRRMRLSKAQVKTAELTFNSGSLTLSQLMEAVNTQHQHNLQHTRLKINYLMNTIQLLSLYGQDPILED